MATEQTSQDILQQVSQVDDQLLKMEAQRNAIIAEQQAILEENAALQKQQNDNSLRRAALGRDRELLSSNIISWTAKRNGLGVQQRVATHEETAAVHSQAAAAARAEAEKLTADLAAKNKEADELLAKLRTQATAEVAG